MKTKMTIAIVCLLVLLLIGAVPSKILNESIGSEVGTFFFMLWFWISTKIGVPISLQVIKFYERMFSK